MNCNQPSDRLFVRPPGPNRVWGIFALIGLAAAGMARGEESFLTPAVKAIDAGDFGSTNVTRAQLDRFLPPARPHPFGQREHQVLQLDHARQLRSIPAEMQWISRDWNGENAQMPYLVYLPETDRVVMLLQCGQPIHSAVITSADRGRTWGPRRWLSRDTNGAPAGVGLGLTSLGRDKLLAFPEDLKQLWRSADAGRSWQGEPEKSAGVENYAWDPMLVVPGAKGSAPRLIQGVWRPTGEPWGSAKAPYSQAYLRSSPNEGQTWSEAQRIPQWLGVNEVYLTRLRHDRWLAACRTDYPARFAHLKFDHYGGLGMTFSSDQGQTWSEVKRVYEWGRHHPSLLPLPGGKLLMTYVVRLGYPDTPQGLPQFGVEAMVSTDRGQTWDFDHRYVLAVWVGNLQGERSWFCSVQSTSTVRLPDGTLLTAFGTGFTNDERATRCKMDVALVRWRLR